VSLFGSAFQKVERANQHIREMETALDGHKEGNGYLIGHEVDDGTANIHVIYKPSFPPDLPLFIGDIVQNLRSALDHATWELIERDGGTRDKQTAFPCCEGTIDDYKAVCRKRIKTICGDTKQFFEDFLAYPEGKGKDLVRLHRLAITDRHKELTPIVHIASIENLKVTHSNGRVERVSRKHFREGSSSFVIPKLTKGEGLIIEVDQETKPTAEIFLDEVDFAQWIPLLKGIAGLSRTVEDCLWQFRNFVSQRHAYLSSDVEA